MQGLRFSNGILPLLAAVLVSACANGVKVGDLTGSSGGITVPTESLSALAIGVASGAVAAGSGIEVGLAPTRGASPWRRFRELLGFPSAVASSACPVYQPGAICAGQTLTLPYATCSFGTSTAIWRGGQTLTFGGGATCGTATLPVVINGETLLRQFAGTIPASNATTRTTSDGETVTLDSQTNSGFASTVRGGVLVTGLGGNQTVSILGVHLVRAGQWDLTVSTPTTAPLAVSSPGTSRIIQSGTVVVQHNLARYVATAVFDNVAYSGSSCFPESGTVTTTFSGARSGGEILAFSGGGGATLLSSTGAAIQFTLAHCF